MANTATWRDSADGILIHQQLSLPNRALRYLLGGPLLLLGGVAAANVVLGPLSFLRDQGLAGLPEAIPGALISLLFAAILAPLGWWITMVKTHKGIAPGAREVFEVTDWRLGQKRKAYPADRYRGVWVGFDALAEVRDGDRGRPVIAAKVLLLPKDPDAHPPFEVAWFDRAAMGKARELGGRVASLLALPAEDALDSGQIGYVTDEEV